MVPFGRIIVGVLLLAVASQAHPTREGRRAAKHAATNEQLMELENELTEAAAANLAARAIKLEQKLEDEIIGAAVETLKDPNPERRAERMSELNEMVRRDKRTVQVITGLLGASSGASGLSSGGTADAAAVAAAQPQGSSAGALLGSVLSSVLGASSSSSGGASGAAAADGTADPNAGSFSALRLLSDSVSTVLRIKFSIFRTLFSLLSGVLSASSGAASGAVSGASGA